MAGGHQVAEQRRGPPRRRILRRFLAYRRGRAPVPRRRDRGRTAGRPAGEVFRRHCVALPSLRAQADRPRSPQRPGQRPDDRIGLPALHHQPPVFRAGKREHTHQIRRHTPDLAGAGRPLLRLPRARRRQGDVASSANAGRVRSPAVILRSVRRGHRFGAMDHRALLALRRQRVVGQSYGSRLLALRRSRIGVPPRGRVRGPLHPRYRRPALPAGNPRAAGPHAAAIRTARPAVGRRSVEPSAASGEPTSVSRLLATVSRASPVAGRSGAPPGAPRTRRATANPLPVPSPPPRPRAEPTGPAPRDDASGPDAPGTPAVSLPRRRTPTVSPDPWNRRSPDTGWSTVHFSFTAPTLGV